MADETPIVPPTDLSKVADEFIKQSLESGGVIETESEQLRVRRTDPYTLMRAAQIARELSGAGAGRGTYYGNTTIRFRGRGRGY